MWDARVTAAWARDQSDASCSAVSADAMAFAAVWVVLDAAADAVTVDAVIAVSDAAQAEGNALGGNKGADLGTLSDLTAVAGASGAGRLSELSVRAHASHVSDADADTRAFPAAAAVPVA